MPFGMWGYPTVVVIKEKVYIGGGAASSMGERRVVVYDPKLNTCNTLPPYTYTYFSMAVINDQLVLVGGCEVETEKKTTKLGVWNEESKRWTHPLPPMTTACYSPSVATHNNRWLMVIGGYGGSTGRTFLSRVEILDTTEPVQWYQAASLPQPCRRTPLAITGNMCYLLGGYTEGDIATKNAFSVCLDDLVSQALSQPASASTSAPPTPSPWQSLPDTPLDYSTTLVLINGALLAVGGGKYHTGSSAIHMYQPSSNSWVKAGELPTKRDTSGCIVLPSGEILVAGGFISSAQLIEIASIR